MASATCPDCDATGEARITVCPRTLRTRATEEYIDLAELWTEHRLSPVAGGVRDQAESFIAGAAIVAGWLKAAKGDKGI